jgi:hypothetical protein
MPPAAADIWGPIGRRRGDWAWARSDNRGTVAPVAATGRWSRRSGRSTDAMMPQLREGILDVVKPRVRWLRRPWASESAGRCGARYEKG